jgi:hypothetical protein
VAEDGSPDELMHIDGGFFQSLVKKSGSTGTEDGNSDGDQKKNR